jgi:hypothetical protein
MNRTNSQKYFIVTVGPTGSGKTGLVKETIKMLGLPENSQYTKFLIDDVIENDFDYKNAVKKIIAGIEDNCVNESSSCLENSFNDPTPELYEQFAKAYYDVRNGNPDVSGKSLGCRTMRSEGKNCEEILDNRLKNIATSQPSIVVFEYTGRYIPGWLFDRTFIPQGYNLVVTYSLVNIDNLVLRNKSRAYEGILKFKSNTGTNPAPRLPNVSEEVFRGLVIEIRNTLIDLYESCIKSRQEKCGPVQIDRLFIFDNNGTSYESIYDSNEGIDDTKLLENIDLALGAKSTGGKKRKSYRKRTKRTKRTKRSKRSKKILLKPCFTPYKFKYR